MIKYHLGPAASLFQKEYYELMKSALKEDGILCSQGLSVYIIIINLNHFIAIINV